MKTFAKAAAGIAGLLLLLVVAYVVACWAPDRPVSELKAQWAPPPSVFVDAGGMQVHLRDEGPRTDPIPLVLLHGTSSSLHTWDGWVAALKGERRVIRIDLPGFGLTGPAPDGDYRIERYVRFMRELLDHLGVGRCVLIGNSFGGHLAWESALALTPARVDRLVLIDASGYPLDSVSVPIGFRVAKIPLLNKIMKVTLPRAVIESSLRNVYGDPAKVTPGLVDRYFAMTVRDGNRAALVQRFAQLQSGAGSDRIRDIRVPTLILWGERDRLIPPDQAARFHADIAGSHMVVLPGLGHVPQEEDPATTVRVAKDFLAGP